MKVMLIGVLAALVALSWNAAEAQGWPGTYCGQIFPSMPEGYTSAWDVCCGQHMTCFQAAGCQARDLPKGGAIACEDCNMRMKQCIGYTLVGSIQAYPSPCTPSCGGTIPACGMPDGCGGFCLSVPSCSWLARWPEMLPVLFWR
jgi:hypothetical protein